MMSFTCSGCGALLSVSPALCGKPARCKKCGTVQRVPEPIAEIDDDLSSDLRDDDEPSTAPTAVRKRTNRAVVALCCTIGFVVLSIVGFVMAATTRQNRVYEMFLWIASCSLGAAFIAAAFSLVFGIRAVSARAPGTAPRLAPRLAIVVGGFIVLFVCYYVGVAILFAVVRPHP
jgi:hypothetical protein